jgi:hypothetical protein
MSNPTTVPSIDYTARDFLTIREALKNHLMAKFPTTWKDFYDSGMGQALMDLVCYSHDVLSFFVDYTANELFLPTARDRLSVLLLGKLLGYQLRTATSASVVVKATIDAVYGEAVIIPAGTSLSSLNGVAFVTTEDFRIEAGQVTANMTFVSGVNRSETFSSDGTAWQKLILSQKSVVEDTVEVLVDGDIWSEISTLVLADGDSKAFSVAYSETGVVTVSFGDGTSGRVPPVGAVLSVAYRTGGGVEGNIALNQLAGTVQGQRELVFPASYVSVTILNDTYRGSGGEDAETVSHAKLWIPYWVRANGRAVTETDYDVLANAFSDPTYGAPAFAKAKLKQEIPELNTVELYVWGRDYAGDVTTPSIGLKNALSAYFNDNGPNGVKCVCTHTEVLDGNIVYIDITMSIRVASNYVEADVLAAVQAAIETLFESSDVQPGSDFRISALYSAVKALPGIDYCLVELLVASYKVTEAIGLGDDLETTFSHTVTKDPGLAIVPETVRMYYGNEIEVLTDDGEGNLKNSLGAVVGTVNYDTGAITGTFTAAPAAGVIVYVEFRHELDYSRNEVLAIGDGLEDTFHGVTKFSPINPYDVSTGLKGLAISDGAQTLLDDGAGNLKDQLGTTVGTVDYDTGAYTFTMPSPPAADANISAAYMQILKTDSEDIPIDKDQMGVKASVTLTTLAS